MKLLAKVYSTRQNKVGATHYGIYDQIITLRRQRNYKAVTFHYGRQKAYN